MRGALEPATGRARALLAALIILLLPGRGAAAPYALDARPVPLADNVGIGDRVGRLRFLGMLALPNITVNGLSFAHLSDLAWDEAAGALYAVSDKGALFQLHPVFRDGILADVKLARAVPLRELKSGEPLRGKRGDAEAVALFPREHGARDGPQLLVSFERFPRVVRYRVDGYAVSEQALPPPLADPRSYRDENRMLEALCHDSRFGLLTMPERPLRSEAAGYNRLYSLRGRSWRYPLTKEARVVSLACLGNGEVLVLESTFGVHFWRAQVSLKRVRLTETAADDTPLAVETLFTLDAGQGYQIDNFEGIARHRGNRFFLVSDDNGFFLQRTLLLYFELIEE